MSLASNFIAKIAHVQIKDDFCVKNSGISPISNILKKILDLSEEI
jgi:hypothetical protein